MAIHLTPEANPTVQEGTLFVDSTTGEFNVAGRTVPHIIPGVLYPAVSGNDLSGTALGGSYVYGTAHTDGRKYYYTDIKGSKPIKDPRIGAYFGSQRHMFKSIQQLEQETAIHGDEVYSIDGREWMRGVGNLEYVNDTRNIQLKLESATTSFFEITGYFGAFNFLNFSSDTARNLKVELDGVTAHAAFNPNGAINSPLGSRYVSAGSVFNVDLTASGSSLSSDTLLGIHTIKFSYVSGYTNYPTGCELIAQDTSNRNNIQIPSQNVVSYGKKFTVSGTPHYDPFNGFTSGSSVSSYVDTATSLGCDNWKYGSTYYRPYNGGRVVKWVDSSGVIKTSVTLMPPNAKSIGNSSSLTNGTAKANASASNDTFYPTFEAHTTDVNEDNLHEVAKTFHFREFGNGSANGGTGASYADASMLTTTTDDIAYVMDDGLTSLSAKDVQDQSSYGAMLPQSSDVYNHFTFIGTGIAVNNKSTNLGAIPFNQIAQNLPYGTHIFGISRNSGQTHSSLKIDGVVVETDFNSGGYGSITEVSFHQPKRPPIPEDACVLADYMLMADFVPLSGTGSQANISKGVRLNSASRDVFYNETDGDSFVINATETEAVTGMNVYLNGTADSTTSAKMRLPSFATNYVVRGYRMEERARLFIDDTDKDAVSHRNDDTNRGSYAYITNNSGNSATISSNETLGVNNFGLNAENNKDPYIGAFEIVTPIHTSFHYQPFETPFLNELVGGDRNLEQTNLVCTSDGRSWDQITRDTSYIGDGVMFTRPTASYDSDSSTMILDDWRGNEDNKDFYNKDFAIAYDRVICLKDGQYILHFQCYRNTLGDRDIRLNGTSFVRSYQSTTGTGTMQVTKSLKRGDYLQLVGRQSNNAFTNFFWIKKA